MSESGIATAPVRAGECVRDNLAVQKKQRRSRLVFHLSVLACYLAAGVALTWPRATYLAGRLPTTGDQGSYVWGFWWMAHQVTHLGNPWFTDHLGAPAGIQLGFDTLMPLLGAAMTPVTVMFGPSAAYNLLAAVLPGLACYAAYRPARLWLYSEAGAIAAGAFYGLATMLAWQDWFHLNIAAGAVWLAATLEATIRLQRRPSALRAVVLGLILGTCVLVNPESAVMAALVAGPALLAWLARDHSLANVRWVILAAGVMAAVASPQIAAMVVQARTGGAAVSPRVIARWDASFGTPLTTLFAPSPRLTDFGLGTAASLYRYAAANEAAPTFGVILTVLALLGLIVGWRRRSVRLLALGWGGAAALALGPVLLIGNRRFAPLPVLWHGVRVSAVMPYTWFVQIPGLDGFREADRLTLLGLLPAALLAGNGVTWLSRRSRPLLTVALALAVLEAGYSGDPAVATSPTAMRTLDGPIAADHSGSIVVDVPFGLRGGVAPWGKPIDSLALVMATADGHPRAVSYTSWVPRSSVVAMRRHPFYERLVAAERGVHSTRRQVLAARQDALRMRLGWAIVWRRSGFIAGYLHKVGFTWAYRAGSVLVYRLMR
jgi:hypothetical protein